MLARNKNSSACVSLESLNNKLGVIGVWGGAFDMFIRCTGSS